MRARRNLFLNPPLSPSTHTAIAFLGSPRFVLGSGPRTYRDGLLVQVVVRLKVVQAQAARPARLVQIEQHLLLKGILAVVDRNRVVVAVQAMDQGLTRCAQ